MLNANAKLAVPPCLNRKYLLFRLNWIYNFAPKCPSLPVQALTLPARCMAQTAIYLAICLEATPLYHC